MKPQAEGSQEADGASQGKPSLDRSGSQQHAGGETIEAFCHGWLDLHCRTIAGVSAGILVLKGENKVFRPAAFWPDGRARSMQLSEIAERALKDRRSQVLKREVQRGPVEPPETRYHIAQPIRVGEILHGVVALELGERPEAEVEKAVRHLDLGCAWLEGLFARNGNGGARTSPAAHAGLDRPQAVLDLLASVLEHQRFQEAAMAFATELSTRLACDRVSVGFLRRKRIQVRALSHSAHFGKKTNLIRAIEAAMDEAHDQESVIVYPEPQGAEYRITRAHAELGRQHGPGAVASIPLSGGPDARSAGVLTLERPGEKPFGGGEVALAEAAAALLGPSLEALRREERPLWAKGADAGRRQFLRLLGPRHPVLKLSVFGLLAAAVFFAFAKGDFRVAAKSALEGEIQRVVVAPFNGFIAQAPARAGDVVREGQVLCVLDDRDLRLEERRLESQREQYTKQYHQAMAQHNSAQVKITAAQIDQVKAQLELVQDQLSRMKVLSPFAGIVSKGDLSQSIGAPVERGQALFEVAPLDRYRLILEVDERDVSFVSPGQRGHLLLTSLPTEKLPFRVEKVTPVSQAREGRNYFRVEARLDGPPGRLRPGMEGVGKVEIDRRRYLWIWTREALDWLRLFFWSWTP